MDETLDELGETIAGALAGRGRPATRSRIGELTVTADGARHRRRSRPSCATIERCQFWSFIDVTGVDWPAREQRFDVVYHLLSPKQNARIRVKVEADEATPVPSIIGVFPGAELVRARGLRPLRRPVHRPSGPAPPPHRLRLRGPSAAQGLPAHRLRRGALRRRAEARRLRAGAAGAGIPQLRFPVAVGRHGLSCCRATRRRRSQAEPS